MSLIRSIGSRIVREVVCSGAPLLCLSVPCAPAATWGTHGPEGAHVQALAIDYWTPTTIYLGAAPGAGSSTPRLFKSTDGGNHWASVGFPGVDVTSLAIDPSAEGIVYVGTAGSLWKTSDGGDHWTALDSGPVNVSALALNPWSATTIYAATATGVSRSTDGGATWTTVNTDLAPPVISLALDLCRGVCVEDHRRRR